MAMRVNDIRAQDLSVRRNRQVALNYFINYMVPVKGPGDLWVDAFIQAWKRVYKSDFPLLYITKISSMPAEAVKIRVVATGKDLGQLNLLYITAVKSKSPKDWEAFRAAGIPLEEKLSGIQDLYFQAVVLQMLGDSHFPDFQDGKGDPEKSFELWGKILEIRRELDYDNDQQYEKVHRDWKGLRYDLGLEPDSNET